MSAIQGLFRRNRLSHLAFAIAAIAMSLGGVCHAAFLSIQVYVAPDGNDAWSGFLSRPNAEKTDGPFATPARARDVAWKFAKESKDSGFVEIRLERGHYYLTEPLVLSKSPESVVHFSWVGDGDGKDRATLSGGRPVTDWQKTTVNGHDAWMAKLPQDTALFRQLWLNNQRLTRARWPKQGTLAVAPAPKAKTHADWRDPASAFPFIAGEIKAWPTLTDGEAIVMSRWVEARLPITGLDENDHLLRSTKKADFSPETGDRYYIENVKECLTEPGEWYFDPREHAIYLIPPADVNSPNDAQVIRPVLPVILDVKGAANVTFKGITFAHTEWYYDHVAAGQKSDKNRTGDMQAAVNVPGAIVLEDTHDCEFDHCTVAHVGSYGIELGRGCQKNKITQCTITDLAAGGVKIGEMGIRDNSAEQAFGNELSDCRITDGGNIFPSAVGVWIGQSHDNTIARNEIGRFWYTGISIGWTWGYGNALSQNNSIYFNEIHHIGKKSDSDQPILSDMGGIYTLGNEKGTSIRSNIFHDIAALHYGGWGIYFDEGTTDIEAKNNLVYRTTHGGFHQHYGKDNIVRNNIFALGRDAQIQRSRLEDHTSFTFENNIVYWDTGNLLAGDWNKFNVAFDHNTYWRQGQAEFRLGNYSWEQWQKAGLDKNSVIADPGFRDPGHGDFTVTADPKNLGGFVPFSIKDVGPHD